MLQCAILQIPTSAFLSGFPTPILSDQQANISSFVTKASLRCSQRIVAEAGFYGSKRIRMDVVMVEINDHIYSSLKKAHLLVWFGKEQVSIRLNEVLDSPEAGDSQESQSCRLENICKEFYLVPFYYIIPPKHLTVDVIDEALNFVRSK